MALSEFDRWFLSTPAITKPDFPMGSELLFLVCGKDPHKFALVTEHVGRAFEAGQRSRSTGEKYRHKKRQSQYELTGPGRMQLEEGAVISDMSEIMVYRDTTDGSLWVRLKSEFEDGRFEKL